MNRSIIACSFLQQRQINVDSAKYEEQVSAWTAKLLSKQPCVPPECVFSWHRGNLKGNSTAYLFDAIMTNVQFAQQQLMQSSLSAGKQAYKSAITAARTYSFVLQELLPKWTFSHAIDIPDCQEHDIYGHYCLARALAYDAVGKADLLCPDTAKLVSAGNAAHMFMMAAQMIEGDCSAMIARAQNNVGEALCMYGEQCLQKWDKDEDDTGAATALACFREAHERLLAAGRSGCEDRVQFATERNQVHWCDPVLPPLHDIIPPRITPLHQ